MLIWYKDFTEISSDEITILVKDDLWIWVTKEEGNLYGVASFGPYVCYTEKHELTPEDAVKEIHKIGHNQG